MPWTLPKVIVISFFSVCLLKWLHANAYFSLVSASYFQHNCPGELPAEIGSVFILQELGFTVVTFRLDVQFHN